MKVMTVTIEKKPHYNYKYLVHWNSPDGYIFHDWFHSMKDIHEYFDKHFPTYCTL